MLKFALWLWRAFRETNFLCRADSRVMSSWIEYKRLMVSFSFLFFLLCSSFRLFLGVWLEQMWFLLQYRYSLRASRGNVSSSPRFICLDRHLFRHKKPLQKSGVLYTEKRQRRDKEEDYNPQITTHAEKTRRQRQRRRREQRYSSITTAIRCSRVRRALFLTKIIINVENRNVVLFLPRDQIFWRWTTTRVV